MILATLICASSSIWANTSCAGFADAKTFVMINVTTSGVMASAQEGELIVEHGGNRYGYQFKRDGIGQYFEYNDGVQGPMMAGLLAHPKGGGPLEVRYVGPNFVDMDLRAVFSEGQAPQLRDNVLRAWKGPGHESTDQYEVTQIVCKKWNNL